jgi:hypothetical protein
MRCRVSGIRSGNGLVREWGDEWGGDANTVSERFLVLYPCSHKSILIHRHTHVRSIHAHTFAHENAQQPTRAIFMNVRPLIATHNRKRIPPMLTHDIYRHRNDRACTPNHMRVHTRACLPSVKPIFKHNKHIHTHTDSDTDTDMHGVTHKRTRSFAHPSTQISLLWPLHLLLLGYRAFQQVLVESSAGFRAGD